MNKILKRSVIALMVLGVSTFSGMYNNVYAKGQFAQEGEFSDASGDWSTAYGTSATAEEYASAAYGAHATAKGKWSTAYGARATAEGMGSTAYGTGAAAQREESVAIGPRAKAESYCSVAIGSRSVAKDDFEFSVGRDAINENLRAVYRRVTHVAYGINAEDAVNVAQLQKVENNFNKMINEIDARVDESSAGAAALSALHPLTNEFDPSNKFDFAVGYGNYRNKSAMALGAYYRPNANVLMSIGGTFGNGDSMVNAGMSFKIGKISKSVKHESETEKEIALLKEQNEKLVKAMQEQNEKFEKAMQEQNEKLVKLEMILQKLETK